MKLLVAVTALFAFVAILTSPKTPPAITVPNLFAAATPTQKPSATPSPTDTPAPTDTPGSTPRPTPRPTPTPTRTPTPTQAVHLSGTAMGTDGKPAGGVTVTVYRATDGVAVASGTTNANGGYSVSVAKNTAYKLFFSGATVFPKWYANATTIGAATIISVGPVDTLGVNMILTKR